MYTVNQGPSRLVAKTRSGLSQNLEKIESFRNIASSTLKSNKRNSNETSNKNIDNGDAKEFDISLAKPVFQQYRSTNSNRNGSYKAARIAFDDTDVQPIPSPQYEELIRYIHDSWNLLSDESENSTENQAHACSERSTNGGTNHSNINRKKKAIIYHNDPPSPELHDFGAFDLESWWGRRLFNNITKSL